MDVTDKVGERLAELEDVAVHVLVVVSEDDPDAVTVLEKDMLREGVAVSVEEAVSEAVIVLVAVNVVLLVVEVVAVKDIEADAELAVLALKLIVRLDEGEMLPDADTLDVTAAVGDGDGVAVTLADEEPDEVYVVVSVEESECEGDGEPVEVAVRVADMLTDCELDGVREADSVADTVEVSLAV